MKLFTEKNVLKAEVRSMLKIKPQCCVCNKEIQPNEEVFVKMRYPETKGMTEIKAFIQYQGKIICKECMNK